jgi:hypothetical protein
MPTTDRIWHLAGPSIRIVNKTCRTGPIQRLQSRGILVDKQKQHRGQSRGDRTYPSLRRRTCLPRSRNEDLFPGGRRRTRGADLPIAPTAGCGDATLPVPSSTARPLTQAEQYTLSLQPPTPPTPAVLVAPSFLRHGSASSQDQEKKMVGLKRTGQKRGDSNRIIEGK